VAAGDEVPVLIELEKIKAKLDVIEKGMTQLSWVTGINSLMLIALSFLAIVKSL